MKHVWVTRASLLLIIGVLVTLMLFAGTAHAERAQTFTHWHTQSTVDVVKM